MEQIITEAMPFDEAANLLASNGEYTLDEAKAQIRAAVRLGELHAWSMRGEYWVEPREVTHGKNLNN